MGGSRLEIRELEGVIEAILFASGDVVSTEKICDIVEVDKKTIKNVLSKMEDRYQKSDRGITVRQIGNGYQMCTKTQHGEFIKKLFEPKQSHVLSHAAYETLAIIAYNNPITKAKIEKIRGVKSDSALAKLTEKNLIKEAGRLDSPGKPILYETTDEFLRRFGFKTLGDLPIIDMKSI